MAPGWSDTSGVMAVTTSRIMLEAGAPARSRWSWPVSGFEIFTMSSMSARKRLPAAWIFPRSGAAASWPWAFASSSSSSQ